MNIDAKTLQRENLELVFEGLDTYARIFLNGSVLLEANNMFQEWRVDCKKLLIEGDVHYWGVWYGESLSVNTLFFRPAKELNLSEPDIRFLVKKSKKSFMVAISQTITLISSRGNLLWLNLSQRNR